MGTVSIGQAFAFAPNFQKGVQSAGRIFHLLNREPKIKNYPGVRDEQWVSNHNSTRDIEYSIYLPINFFSRVALETWITPIYTSDTHHVLIL